MKTAKDLQQIFLLLKYEKDNLKGHFFVVSQLLLTNSKVLYTKLFLIKKFILLECETLLKSKF